MWMNDNLACCGLGELSDFPTNPDKERLVLVKADVARCLGLNCNFSHIIVTLKKDQITCGPVLKKLGFKVVGSAVNPKTDNTLTMYVYLRPKKKPAPKRKPKLNFK